MKGLGLKNKNISNLIEVIKINNQIIKIDLIQPKRNLITPGLLINKRLIKFLLTSYELVTSHIRETRLKNFLGLLIQVIKVNKPILMFSRGDFHGKGVLF